MLHCRNVTAHFVIKALMSEGLHQAEHQVCLRMLKGAQLSLEVARHDSSKMRLQAAISLLLLPSMIALYLVSQSDNKNLYKGVATILVIGLLAIVQNSKKNDDAMSSKNAFDSLIYGDYFSLKINASKLDIQLLIRKIGWNRNEIALVYTGRFPEDPHWLNSRRYFNRSGLIYNPLIRVEEPQVFSRP